MDQYSSDTGNLNVIVTGTDSYSPLSSATIEIANTGEPNRILESVNTDRNGQTGNIELSAPPREYSMEPTDNQPYSEYNVKISAPGYQEGLVSGVQIFSGENGLQSIVLQPSEFVDKCAAYAKAFHTIDWMTFGIGMLALLIQIFWPKVSAKIPGSLISILVTTLIVQLGKLPVATIGLNLV